jgi:transcription initiation factor TFIIIB Brf1 subunit/transcription initiation factor TFIIB
VPEVLDAHKKKLSRMRKWKRKLEVANRRKQEKEEAWANELNRFRDGAHVCHTVLVAAVELA